MFNFIIVLAELLTSTIYKINYLGIFLGMVMESSFIPFPSEVILIPSGALVAQGQLSFTLILVLAILGSLVGALINFALALFLGRKVIDFLISKYGKILFLTKTKLKKTDNYFNKYGSITTFIGRLIPVIRQLISLPAGFSKMNLTKFCIFTSLGAGIWSLILISTGYFLGSNSQLIKENPLMITIDLLLISLIIIIIYLFIKKKH